MDASDMLRSVIIQSTLNTWDIPGCDHCCATDANEREVEAQAKLGA
jgi:hypothetical protein